jgi:hypothetical protein
VKSGPAARTAEAGVLLIEGLVAIVIIGLVVASTHRLHGTVTEARRSNAELRLATWTARAVAEVAPTARESAGSGPGADAVVTAGPHVVSLAQERRALGHSWQPRACRSPAGSAAPMEGIRSTASTTRRDLRASIDVTVATSESAGPSVSVLLTDGGGGRLPFMPELAIAFGSDPAQMLAGDSWEVYSEPEGLCARYRTAGPGPHAVQIVLDGYVTRDHRPLEGLRSTVMLHTGTATVEVAVGRGVPVDVSVDPGSGLMNDRGTQPLRWSLTGDSGAVSFALGERRTVFPGEQTVRVGVCGHAAEAGSMAQVELEGVSAATARSTTRPAPGRWSEWYR